MSLSSVSTRAPLLLAGLLCFLLPDTAAARQAGGETLRGRVLLGDAGVAGVPVELHRVTPRASGVAGRALTDAAGGFEFRLPPPDTAGFTVYFATAEYGTVRHFGRPLHAGDDRSDYRVQVFDTTSAPALPVRLGRRDLVLIPQGDGGWEVNEVVRILNPGERTVVSAGGLPTATVHLPPRADAFQAGEGEATGEQVKRMGDRALVVVAIPPGERELFLRYRLPPRPSRLELPATGGADTLNVYVRQPAPRLDVKGLIPSDLVQVEGERFLRYTSGGVEGEVRMTWAGTGPPVSPVVAAVALTLSVLLIGGVAAYRNRR